MDRASDFQPKIGPIEYRIFVFINSIFARRKRLGARADIRRIRFLDVFLPRLRRSEPSFVRLGWKRNCSKSAKIRDRNLRFRGLALKSNRVLEWRMDSNSFVQKGFSVRLNRPFRKEIDCSNPGKVFLHIRSKVKRKAFSKTNLIQGF